ncbi:MAG: DNA-3-methyladenine glycosylase 2 family protein [Caldilineaceae bacterium SB0668_bin_21]|nr:DNA-3-methyladenine glycosylase 2 family protein [Caldilineaceae bacterium SB0668_bin_21]MYC20758.1 DNA-3-methyladenine glycosylase 2 family protein [Caldilineaceae bacterium SB0662_bin_25]
MKILSQDTLNEGLQFLSAQDADLAGVLTQHGPPNLRSQPPGFPALLKIILGQQVSRSSAASTYQRLCDAIGPPEPASFQSLDDEALRAIGFSRQKSRYGRELASAILDGRLQLDRLADRDDDEVRTTLTALPGIGPWSAEIYLLFALRRTDAWPASDLGIIVGAQKVKGLPARPSRQELDAMAENWRPWRGLATFILWHGYQMM